MYDRVFLEREEKLSDPDQTKRAYHVGLT